MNRSPFPEALIALLEERDWTIRELGRRMEDAEPAPSRKQITRGHWEGAIHFSTLARMAGGQVRPSMRAMELIAKTLRIKPEFFPEYRLEKRRDELKWWTHGLDRALRALGE